MGEVTFENDDRFGIYFSLKVRGSHMVNDPDFNNDILFTIGMGLKATFPMPQLKDGRLSFSLIGDVASAWTSEPFVEGSTFATRTLQWLLVANPGVQEIILADIENILTDILAEIDEGLQVFLAN